MNPKWRILRSLYGLRDLCVQVYCVSRRFNKMRQSQRFMEKKIWFLAYLCFPEQSRQNKTPNLTLAHVFSCAPQSMHLSLPGRAWIAKRSSWSISFVCFGINTNPTALMKHFDLCPVRLLTPSGVNSEDWAGAANAIGVMSSSFNRRRFVYLSFVSSVTSWNTQRDYSK